MCVCECIGMCVCEGVCVCVLLRVEVMSQLRKICF